MSDRPTRLPALLTRPMSWVYRMGAEKKARGFDSGRGVFHLDRPVISVGNLSAGGTGKTPMVHFVVRTLIDAGHNPVVAMRGYKAKKGELGDEATEYRTRFPDLPLVVQPDRRQGLDQLFATEPGELIDCVVLDDGFQHRQIARDLDLVLVDASRPPAHDALLPHGYLREPESAMSRADAIIVTHAEMANDSNLDALIAWTERAASSKPIAISTHDWDGFDIHVGADSYREGSDWIQGQRILVVCAIGNPRGFLSAAERAGAVVIDSLVLGDHNDYGSGEIDRITDLVINKEIDAVLTTQKDWVKLRGSRNQIPAPVAVPRLKLGFRAGEHDLETLILSVFACERRPPSAPGTLSRNNQF